MTGYTYLWEFRIRPDRRDEFERHYGPGGTWANLFRRSRGYLGTLLLRDEADPSRFVTIDRWENAETYRAFREHFSDDYRRLDERCEDLTVDERLIGEFAELVD